MTGEQPHTGLALSEVEIKALERHYEHALKRILHEYDQRDRDFKLHIAINAGLFAAVGVVVKWSSSIVPGHLIVTGIGLLVLSWIGCSVAKLLLKSVQSFVFWQTTMNAVLARIELAILPSARFSLWAHIIAADSTSLGHIRKDKLEILSKLSEINDVPKEINDLIYNRENLAKVLLRVWKFIGFMAIVLIGNGIFSFVSSQWQNTLKVIWS